MSGPLIKAIENNDVATKKTQKVWGKGPIRIHDLELDCYILGDGFLIIQILAFQWKITSVIHAGAQFRFPMKLSRNKRSIRLEKYLLNGYLVR